VRRAAPDCGFTQEARMLLLKANRLKDIQLKLTMSFGVSIGGQ
jgi:hypothetical protein